MSRSDSSSRGDPADSVRAVNALLTQIDRIRMYKFPLLSLMSLLYFVGNKTFL